MGGLLAGGFRFYGTQLEPVPHTELGMLLYVLQLYRDKDFQVIFDGRTYNMPAALQEARKSLLVYYHGEGATAWIRTHLYRSPKERNIIYLAFPDGSRRPLRDVLIEELQKLSAK